MKFIKNVQHWVCIAVLSCSFSVTATDFEVTALFGKMYGSDLQSSDGQSDIAVDNSGNFGLAIAWQDSPNGQGQILLNKTSHDFNSELDNSTRSLDITYAHFNGVAQFRQQHYVTTVSLGLGGAYFESDNSEDLYPSASIAFGTRYEISNNIALVTELRGYASIVDEKDNTFCSGEICHAKFNDTLWIDSNISIGIAVKF